MRTSKIQIRSLLAILIIAIYCNTGESQSIRQVEFTVDVVINMQSSLIHGEKDSVDLGSYTHALARRGSNYVVREGFIYPGNFLAINCTEMPGIGYTCGGELDSNGRFVAQFNDDVIGTWDCQGWFTESIMGLLFNPNPEPVVYDISTQKFTFPYGIKDEDGNIILEAGTIVTEGSVEFLLGNSFERAIIGGYGSMRSALGSVSATNIGVNFETIGAHFSATFKLMLPAN